MLPQREQREPVKVKTGSQGTLVFAQSAGLQTRDFSSFVASVPALSDRHE